MSTAVQHALHSFGVSIGDTMARPHHGWGQDRYGRDAGTDRAAPSLSQYQGMQNGSRYGRAAPLTPGPYSPPHLHDIHDIGPPPPAVVRHRHQQQYHPYEPGHDHDHDHGHDHDHDHGPAPRPAPYHDGVGVVSDTMGPPLPPGRSVPTVHSHAEPAPVHARPRGAEYRHCYPGVYDATGPRPTSRYQLQPPQQPPPYLRPITPAINNSQYHDGPAPRIARSDQDKAMSITNLLSTTPANQPGLSPPRPHTASHPPRPWGWPPVGEVNPASEVHPVPATAPAPRRPPASSEYHIRVRQQPVAARSCGFGERDRRVIDPPPIVQLAIADPTASPGELSRRLRFPFTVLYCTIFNAAGDCDSTSMPEDYRQQRRLMGTLVASSFVGLDEHGAEGCFFCFPDLSCRTPGTFRLKFSLVVLDPQGMREGGSSAVVATAMSDVFTVYNAKDFPGMTASTALTKRLKEQGCLISIKKGNDKAHAAHAAHASHARDDSDGDGDGDEHDAADDAGQRKRRRVS